MKEEFGMEFIIVNNDELIQEASRLFDQYRQFYGQKSNLEACYQFLKTRHSKNESFLFLGKQDLNTPAVAMAQVYPLFSSIHLKPVWILNDLFIDETYRDQGIGKFMMRSIHAKALTENIHALELSTSVRNLIAQKLYTSFGYSHDQEFIHLNLVLKK